MSRDELAVMDGGKCILQLRGVRPFLSDKYDLLRHPCIRFTEDGGAPPYDYTAADQAADDLPGEAADWELLDMDDFLPQPKRPQPPFRTLQYKTTRRNVHESLESQNQRATE